MQLHIQRIQLNFVHALDSKGSQKHIYIIWLMS